MVVLPRIFFFPSTVQCSDSPLSRRKLALHETPSLPIYMQDSALFTDSAALWKPTLAFDPEAQLTEPTLGGNCLEEDFLSPKVRGSLTVHFREKKRGPVSTTPYKVWALNG